MSCVCDTDSVLVMYNNCCSVAVGGSQHVRGVVGYVCL